MRWQIITGEYPPQIGGISDYTRQAALGLVAAGDAVDIWTGPAAGPAGAVDPGITVHRLPDHFGSQALAAMDAAFAALPAGERRILVQYEPWSFGWRGMNFPFCFWLWRRGRGWDLTVMFHEVCTDLGWRMRPKQNVLGLATRITAGLVVRGARRAFVSIPAWAALLRPMAGRAKSIECLPIPSSLPNLPDPAAVASRRRELQDRAGVGAGGLLVGHFGTFRGHVVTALAELLPPVLRHGAGAVLVGRDAEAFGTEFRRGLDPALAARVITADSLALPAVAEHLAACDVLVQPYPDGVSARRTSTMAGLFLGAALVTNTGGLSEDFWATCDAVRATASPEPAALAAAVIELLDDPPEQTRLRAAAARFYAANFSAERVIDALRGPGPAPHARSA